MLGVYLQRSCLILFTTCIILTPIYIFASPILKLLGQDDEIADLAGNFTPLIVPSIFALGLIFPTRKFLQAQSKVYVLTWIGLVGLALHIAMLWIFIYKLGRHIDLNYFNRGSTLFRFLIVVCEVISSAAQILCALKHSGSLFAGLKARVF